MSCRIKHDDLILRKPFSWNVAYVLKYKDYCFYFLTKLCFSNFFLKGCNFHPNQFSFVFKLKWVEFYFLKLKKIYSQMITQTHFGTKLLRKYYPISFSVNITFESKKVNKALFNRWTYRLYLGIYFIWNHCLVCVPLIQSLFKSFLSGSFSV